MVQIFPIKVIHTGLGLCIIDEACFILQQKNSDSTSIFINHAGEIKEVTKACVKLFEKDSIIKFIQSLT